MTIANDGASGLADAIKARGYNWATYFFFAAGLAAALLALRRQLEPHMPVIEAWDTESPSPSGRGQAPEGTEGDDETSEEHGTFFDESPALVPVLIVMATGLLLILGAELFYVKDVFGSRLNTVFKLSYQAWLLLAISGAYSLWWLVNRWQPALGGSAAVLRGVWSAFTVLVLAGGLLYPLGATLARTHGFSSSNRTLDGLQAARRANAEDYAAIDWLSDHAGRDERIVEGTGGPYSSAGRVASATGIPIVIGWVGHEVQWGRNADMLGRRQSDVDELYTTTDMADALRILQQYDVTYVFVGSVERAKYPPAGLDKFNGSLPVAVSFGNTSVFRVPRTPSEDSNAAAP
jgi:uncharacterized membrane protein